MSFSHIVDHCRINEILCRWFFLRGSISSGDAGNHAGAYGRSNCHCELMKLQIKHVQRSAPSFRFFPLLRTCGFFWSIKEWSDVKQPSKKHLNLYKVGPYDRFKWSYSPQKWPCIMGNWDYNPYKWRYGPLLIPGSGAHLVCIRPTFGRILGQLWRGLWLYIYYIQYV